MTTSRITDVRDRSIVIAFSFIASVALCMNFSIPSIADSIKVNPIAEIVFNLKYSLSNTSALSTLIFAFIMSLGFYSLRHISKEKIKGLPLGCCFVAIIWLMAKSFIVDNTLQSLYFSPGQIVKSILYFVGSAYLLWQLGMALYYFLRKSSSEKRIKSNSKSGFLALINRHMFISTVLCLIVFWTPYTIISYPGYTCADVWGQINQYFGVYSYTSHHPPVHTLLVGAVIDLGTSLFGKLEAGFFLFIILQSLTLIFVIANTLQTMKHFQCPPWLIYGALFFYIICPYIGGYMALLLKDNQYSTAFLLYITELAYLMFEKNRRKISLRHYILCAVGCLGVLLFRNNGKYVIYPFTVILIIRFLRQIHLNKPSRKTICMKLSVLLIPVLLAFCINSYVVKKYNVQSGSIREALSLPIQQTARYVREHGEELTDEEKAIIDATFNSSDIGDAYNPFLSDPVKGSFIYSPTVPEISRYLKMWLSMFFKHPMSYIAATVNQNYLLIVPFVENDIMYGFKTVSFPEHYEALYNAMKDDAYSNLDQYDSDIKKTIAGELETLLFSLPFVGMLSSLGFHNMIFLALVIFAIHNRKWIFLLYTFPLTLTNIVTLLAPAVRGHARYAFPVIYSMPLIIAIYLYLIKATHSSDQSARKRAKRSDKEKVLAST